MPFTSFLRSDMRVSRWCFKPMFPPIQGGLSLNAGSMRRDGSRENVASKVRCGMRARERQFLFVSGATTERLVAAVGQSNQLEPSPVRYGVPPARMSVTLL